MLLHVGTPKTGTSYLQDVLFRNRKVLAHADIRYPADRFDAHFLAALDLMRMPWGGLEAEAIGAWDRLAEEVRAHRHTSIISHEILATASRSQIGRALTSLGHDDGTEIHIVLSVRDLVRQIPAEWQENVKHRSGIAYGAFLDQIRDPERESRIATWFWGVQEIPDILDRWGHDLPPERIHLVTVPPAGGAPELLWKRFSQVFGLDGLDLDLEPDRAQPVARCAGDRTDPPDQPQRQPRPRARRLPAAGARAARPPDAVASPRLAPAGSAARRLPLGPRHPAVVGRRRHRPRVRRGGRSRRAARPAPRRMVRPRRAFGEAGGRRRRGRDHGAAARERQDAADRGAPRRRARRDPARPGPVLPAADVPVPGEGWSADCRVAGWAGGCCASTGGARRNSSRSA